MSKNYVLYSTPESRENHTTSLLAIFETIFFVLLTWGIAYYFDTYIHIYIAIAIAPFLLLRTPESTEKAIEWFLYESEIYKETYYEELIFWLIYIITSLLYFTISYFFFSQVLIHYKDGELFLLSITLAIILTGMGITVVLVLGIITIITIVTIGGILGILGEDILIFIGFLIGVLIGIEVIGTRRIKKNKNRIFKKLLFPIVLLIRPLLGLGLGFGFFLKSILIKFITTTIYTVENPKITFFAISKNWHEQIAVHDIFHSPELLPEIYKKNNFFQFSGFLSNFKTQDLTGKIFLILITPVLLLSYFYRFSIKSTAWFFFPLAYLANLTALQDENKKEQSIKNQTWDRLFWFNLVIAAVLFLYFKFSESYLKLLKLSEEQLNFIKTQVANLREYFVPEAMWLLVVAVSLYFIMNTFISQKEHLEEKNYGLFSFWIIRFIYSLWMVFLGWHIVVFTNQYVLPELAKIFEMP